MKQGMLERQIRFASYSAGFNIVIAVGKLLIGLFGASLILCLYAFCNVGMAAAKLAAVRNHRLGGISADEEEWLCYFNMGLIVAASGIIFLLYSLAVWHYGHTPNYSLRSALLIAAVSFTEIGIAVSGMFVAGRAKKPLVTAIKLTNLAFSLFTLSLTQTALLAVRRIEDYSAYNARIGMLLGGISLLIGLGMSLRASSVMGAASPLRTLSVKRVRTGEGMPNERMDASRIQETAGVWSGEEAIKQRSG